MRWDTGRTWLELRVGFNSETNDRTELLRELAVGVHQCESCEITELFRTLLVLWGLIDQFQIWLVGRYAVEEDARNDQAPGDQADDWGDCGDCGD